MILAHPITPLPVLVAFAPSMLPGRVAAYTLLFYTRYSSVSWFSLYCRDYFGGRLRHEDVFVPKIQPTIKAEVKLINRLVDEPTCGIRHKRVSTYEINPRLSVAKNEAQSVFFHPGTGIVQHSPQNHTTFRRTKNEYDGLLKTAEIGCHFGHKEVVWIILVVP